VAVPVPVLPPPAGPAGRRLGLSSSA